MAPDQGATTKKEAETFRDEQRTLAADQLTEGDQAVPEQRPIASQRAEANEGPIARRIREAGGLPGDKAMDKEAYDRANSDSQRKKAEKDERQERFAPAAAVQIVNPDDPINNGRVGAITRVASWKDVEHERLAAAGTPESRFAEVDEYELRTRDERHELLIVSAKHVRRLGGSVDQLPGGPTAYPDSPISTT